MDHAVAKRGQRVSGEIAVGKIFWTGEGTSSKTTRQVIIIKIGYVLNVLQINRSQIKNIQLSAILILEFATLFKETTPQNHPSALRPSINRRLRRLDHNHLSHWKRKQWNKRKIIKATKDIECCLNCATDCLQGLKFKFSQIFLGVACWTPSPYLFPFLSGFGLCPQFSGTSRHRFQPALSCIFPSEILTWLRLWNSPTAFAISNFFGGDTPNSSFYGVRGRW